MSADVQKAISLLHKLKRLQLQQQQAPLAAERAVLADETRDHEATVVELMHIEHASRQRELSTPGRFVTLTAAAGAPRADGTVFAPINPPLRNVRALRVIGGAVHHPAAPTFRTGVDDTIPFVYAQHWPLERMRLYGSLSAAGCISVRFEMSAESSDSGDAAKSAMHRSLGNVVALQNTVLVGVQALSIDVGPSVSIVVSAPEAPAAEGALLSTTDKRIKGTVVCNGATLVGSGTSFASQLKKGDSIYVVERATGANHVVVVTGTPVSDSETVTVDGAVFGLSNAWVDTDAYRVDLVRSTAAGVSFPLGNTLEGLKWEAVGFFARSPVVTLCRRDEGPETRSKFMLAFANALQGGGV